MTTIEVLHKDPIYQTVRPHVDTANATHWCFMHSSAATAESDYRPCFNPRLMREMHAFLRRTTTHIQTCEPDTLSHVVLASDSDVFNLGGDLRLFAQYIKQNNREALFDYAKECIDGVYTINSNLDANAHTVALVQGDALGGGLELALSCSTVIAESGVQMGFPEVLFGLFPGMGAYSLISRKASPRIADELMTSGNIYSSDELHKMGLIDVLVEKGDGIRAVHEFVRKNRRIASTRIAMNKIHRKVNQISLTELTEIVEVWVDTALNLQERSIKTMERLVSAQNRRSLAKTATPAYLEKKAV